MADGLLNKASIILTPTGYKAGTLYNVAPVVEPYEDFDFARASVASRVNSSGLVEMVGRTLGSELVTNGDFATDSDWTLGTNWTIANGKASADGSSQGTLSQIETVAVIGKTYEIKYEISEYDSGNIRFYYGGVFTTFRDEDGSYTEYITATNTDGTITTSIDTPFNGSIDNVSVKEIIDTNNIPRISYDSNGDNGHILLEPTSTNLLPYSEDFTTWTINAATTVYSNTTETLSPSGEYNASKITSDGSNGLYKAVAFGGGDNTKSIYLKGIVGGEQVILRDPAQTITQKTLTLTTDWVRYDLSENQTSTIGLWINEIPSNGIYMWGAQLEALSYATSYIPTLTGSQEVRETETATGAGSADLINSTEGVLYAEIAALANDGTFREITLNDGSGDNVVEIRYFNTDNLFQFVVRNGGSAVVASSFALTDATEFAKIAFSYKTDDYKMYVNGVEVATDTSGTMPSGLNNLSFNWGGSNPFYGKCKALAVFDEALSDSELTQLTT